MEAAAIVTRSLTKSYGSRRAVDGLDLDVQRAEVFGFLGPNGAGKTTTIRILLGLVRPTSGRAEVFGRDVTLRGGEVLPRVGALVEAPALYGYLSGLDNLLCFGDVLGGVPRRRVDEVLELVGLRDRQHDRVKSYSLGMKQRLAVAIAILHDPELLVLDEPANGLDPAGIVEMRELLRGLAGAGKTVVVCSHVLAEVQETCDRVAIVDRGRLVRMGPVAELTHGSGEFVVRVERPEAALQAVSREPWGAAARLEEGALVTTSPTGRGRELADFLARSGFPPDGLGERQQSLEDIFLQLTGGLD